MQLRPGPCILRKKAISDVGQVQSEGASTEQGRSVVRRGNTLQLVRGPRSYGACASFLVLGAHGKCSCNGNLTITDIGPGTASNGTRDTRTKL